MVITGLAVGRRGKWWGEKHPQSEIRCNSGGGKRRDMGGEGGLRGEGRGCKHLSSNVEMSGPVSLI